VVIAIVICYLLSEALKRVPPQFRKQDPALVWLLLIPCFNLIWNFFVFPKVSQSYKAYFDSVGRTDVGTCAAGLGMGYCICAVISIVPCVGFLAGVAGLVLLIMFLVEITRLKNQISAA
jgi:hypothetical protein